MWKSIDFSKNAFPGKQIKTTQSAYQGGYQNVNISYLLQKILFIQNGLKFQTKMDTFNISYSIHIKFCFFPPRPVIQHDPVERWLLFRIGYAGIFFCGENVIEPGYFMFICHDWHPTVCKKLGEPGFPLLLLLMKVSWRWVYLSLNL